MKEYTRKNFAEWNCAVEAYELRKEAIATLENKKNIELTGIKDSKKIGEIYNEFDASFAKILKEYPVKTIHDFLAIDRFSREDGYRVATHLDQYFRGKKDKPDALQKIILEIVEKSPNISERKLLEALEAQKGNGVIVDIDDNFISVGAEEMPILDIPISGLKDRLSRAKRKFALTG